MSKPISLPARLDVDAACDLWAECAQAEGPLVLDAADLRHVGAAGLQVLLLADRIQQGKGRRLSLINLGADGAARLALMGAGAVFPAGDAPITGRTA